MCYLSCMHKGFESQISIITMILAFIIIMIGILVDTTYFIREKAIRKFKDEEINK